MSVVRWAMVGTGLMADLILRDFALVPNTKLVSLVSRDQERGAAKLAQHGIDGVTVTDFESAIADPEIDLVYVASPHSEHFWMTKAALEAGKHVLCEKAFTMDAAEAIELDRIAKAQNRFLMEAMWTKFNPLLNELHKVVASGRIGKLKVIETNFGFGNQFNESHRLFSAELGGGTTLDQGVYTTSVIRWFAGSTLEALSASGEVYPNGCDALAVTKFEFVNGVIGVGASALSANLGTAARLIGDLGVIEIKGSFWSPEEAHIISPISWQGAPEPELLRVPKLGAGYTHMIQRVSEAVLAGETECYEHPVAWSIETMEMLDQIRSQIAASSR